MSRTKYLFFFCFVAVFFESFLATTVLFSPDDNVEAELLTLLKGAKKRILVATYNITNKKLTQSLIQAQKKEIEVQIITDASMTQHPKNTVNLLRQHKIPVFSFQESQASAYGPLMHHKFAVIDDRIVTGSMNWTYSALHKNQENIIILDDPAVLEKFIQQFEKLKRRCAKLPEEGKKTNNSVSIRSWLANLTRWRM